MAYSTWPCSAATRPPSVAGVLTTCDTVFTSLSKKSQLDSRMMQWFELVYDYSCYNRATKLPTSCYTFFYHLPLFKLFPTSEFKMDVTWKWKMLRGENCSDSSLDEYDSHKSHPHVIKIVD